MIQNTSIILLTITRLTSSASSRRYAMFLTGNVFTTFKFRIQVRLTRFFNVSGIGFLKRTELSLQVRLVCRVFYTRRDYVSANCCLLRRFRVTIFNDGSTFPIPLICVGKVRVTRFFVNASNVRIYMSTVSQFSVMFNGHRTFPFNRKIRRFDFNITRVFSERDCNAFRSVRIIVSARSFRCRR